MSFNLNGADVNFLCKEYNVLGSYEYGNIYVDQSSNGPDEAFQSSFGYGRYTALDTDTLKSYIQELNKETKEYLQKNTLSSDQLTSLEEAVRNSQMKISVLKNKFSLEEETAKTLFNEVEKAVSAARDKLLLETGEEDNLSDLEDDFEVIPKKNDSKDDLDDDLLGFEDDFDAEFDAEGVPSIEPSPVQEKKEEKSENDLEFSWGGMSLNESGIIELSKGVSLVQPTLVRKEEDKEEFSNLHRDEKPSPVGYTDSLRQIFRTTTELGRGLISGAIDEDKLKELKDRADFTGKAILGRINTPGYQLDYSSITASLSQLEKAWIDKGSGEKIYSCPELYTITEAGKGGYGKTDTLEDMIDKVKGSGPDLSKGEKITERTPYAIPLVLKTTFGGHIVSILITDKGVEYYDPKAEDPSHYPLKDGKTVKDFLDELAKIYTPQNTEIKTQKLLQQKDNHSCGLYSIHFHRARLLEKKPFEYFSEVKIRTDNMNTLRKYVMLCIADHFKKVW